MTKVHILASVRKEELLPAATLVFKTLRTGFPTANVFVQFNVCERIGWIENGWLETVTMAASKAGASCEAVSCRTHHQWIVRLIQSEQEPFFLLDTDVIFWDNFEQFDFSGVPLAGRFTPKFFCKFANAITQSRLHTSLLWIDPVKVRELVKNQGDKFPDIYCLPRPNLEDLIYPRYIPQRNGQSSFYDTASLLWHFIGGHSFGTEQLNCYDHLHAGTLSDVLAQFYPEYRMRETHFSIFENPQLAKGSWRLQDEFYAKHAW